MDDLISRQAKMINLNIMTATLEEFMNLPFYWEPDMKFDRLIVVPQENIHDSGYSTMSYVLVKEGKIVGKIGMASDMLHIDGIGGYGEWWPDHGIPTMIPVRSWSIDCLPSSKCVCLFCGNHHMKLSRDFDGISNCLSDISVYVED